MRQPYRLLQTAFLVMLLMQQAGCTRNVDVHLPPHQPGLVLHGYIAVGDSFALTLGRTVKGDVFMTQDEALVKNGWMVLFEGSQFLDSLKFDPASKTYRSALVRAQANKTYRVLAGAPGFTSVEAVAASPSAVAGATLTHILNARVSASGVLLDDVKFSFADPAAEKNYYQAALYPATAISSVCVYTYEPSIERYTGDFVPFNQNSCIPNDQIFYTDKAFNGQQKEIVISAGATDLKPYTDPATGARFRPYLKRYHLSGEHYRYLKDLIALGYAAGDASLANPVLVRGNVKNGFGLFAVYTQAVDSLP